MSDLYLVTVEASDDGTWWDDPKGFDTEREAREFAAKQTPPEGYTAEVYECRMLTILKTANNTPD